MDIENLLMVYNQTDDKIIRKHLGMALRRAVWLYTQENMLDNEQAANTFVTKEEIHIGCSENKIEAIKAYRTRTGCLLKEAKEAIENYFDRNGLKFHQNQNLI